MTEVIFASKSSQDSGNIAGNSERLLNLMAEGMTEGAVTPLILRQVPGQNSWGDTGQVLLRAMETINGTLYVVAAGKLLSVTSGGVATVLGTVTDDTETIIDGNGASVTISAGGNYYVWDGATLTQPAGGLLTSVGSVAFSGFYTVLTEQDGNRFEWTDLAAPESRDALNFATCEGSNDNIQRVIPSQNYIWLFNEESTEVWYATGASGSSAFGRLAGGVLNVGIKSKKLGVAFDAGIFFVGNDSVVYRSAGNGVTPISIPAVVTAIEESTPTHCDYYEYRDHKLCVILFSDRPAWVFDFATGLWHERSTGVNHEAWEAVTMVFAYNKWLCGIGAGQIYEMTGTSDVNHPLKRTAVSKTLNGGGKLFVLAEYEAKGLFGETDIGRDAQIMARFSRDSGRTWGNEKWRSLGNLGNRETRAVWRGQGQYRNLTVEISITEDADIPIFAQHNLRIS